MIVLIESQEQFDKIHEICGVKPTGFSLKLIHVFQPHVLGWKKEQTWLYARVYENVIHFNLAKPDKHFLSFSEFELIKSMGVEYEN